MTLLSTWRTALADPLIVEQAGAALILFKSWCVEQLPRVPGMATGDRLAIRVHAGWTIDQAAAREYLYRWNLAIKDFDQCGGNASSIFGTPHPIGL